MGSWPRSELFAWLQTQAGIDDTEMNRTFNNGLGMVVVVPASAATDCAATLRRMGEQVHVVGSIETRGTGPAVVLR